jgi:two-component system, NarL family, response regulator NreC
MGIRVLIADDHKIVRDGLRILIDKQKDLEVIGEAQNGREAVQFTKKLLPDVVLMDVSMPDMNGIEATRQITREFRRVKIIALSMHSDRRFVKDMLEAGASGYLLKDCAFGELANAIRCVSENKSYLSPGISDIVVHDLKKASGNGDQAHSRLSNRERELLQLLTEGKSKHKIAEQLNISVKTVEAHRRNIMTTLDIKSMAELVKYAIREGFSTLYKLE